MIQNKAYIGAFTRRLADIVEGDEYDPHVFVESDEESRLREDGTVYKTGTGSEAVLIVRGPMQGRKAALRQLLARLEEV